MRAAQAAVSLEVRVRFFGRYAEALGCELEVVSVSAPATVADVIATLRADRTRNLQLPQAPLVAIDLQHVHANHPIADGDELAILPPMAGG